MNVKVKFLLTFLLGFILLMLNAGFIDRSSIWAILRPIAIFYAGLFGGYYFAKSVN